MKQTHKHYGRSLTYKSGGFNKFFSLIKEKERNETLTNSEMKLRNLDN